MVGSGVIATAVKSSAQPLGQSGGGFADGVVRAQHEVLACSHERGHRPDAIRSRQAIRKLGQRQAKNLHIVREIGFRKAAPHAAVVTA
jgi:hypothetical protein